MGAHTVGCALGDTTNFNNSLRKKTNLFPFFPLWGGECVCAHVHICTHGSEHQMSEDCDSGVTWPHLQQPHMLTAGSQVPTFAQTPKLLAVPSFVSLKAQAHLVTHLGRKLSREGRATACPVVSQAPLSQVMTWGPQPLPLSTWQTSQTSQGEHRARCWFSGLCVPSSPETG